MKNRIVLVLMFSTGLSAPVLPAFWASPAFAEDERASTVEEIVVTAQKREESLQAAPIAISAFSAEDLDNLSVYTAQDIGRFTPNMTVTVQPASTSNANFTIRGITDTEPSMSIDPGVGVYMDGIYMARNNGLVFDVVDLKRIEVLRGPQGTLYGRNTTGGAVNLVTAKPKGEWALKQTLGVGRHSRFRSHTTIDFPAFAGISTKFTYLHKEQNGYVRNITKIPQQGRADDFGAIDADAYRFALNWAATDNFTVDYSYDKTKESNTPQGFQLTKAEAIPASVFGPNYNPALSLGPNSNDTGIADQVLLGTWRAFGNTPVTRLCSVDTAASGCLNWANTSNPIFGGFTPSQALLGQLQGVYGKAAAVADSNRKTSLDLPYAGKEKVNIEGHGLTLTWDVSDSLTLKSITGYRALETKLHSDLSGGAYLDLRAFGGGVNTLFAAGQPNIKKQRQFSQELQFIGTLDRIQYVGGLYYFQENGNEETLEQTAFSFGNWTTHTLYRIDNQAWAAYGQATWTPPILEDRLNLTAGLRYTEDNRELRLDRVVGLDSESGVFRKDFSNLNWNITGAYDFTDDLNAYAKIATGYKSGGYLSRTSVANQKPFKPEKLISYELGMKSTWWENRVRLNMALFMSKYQDKQVTQFVPTPSGAESTTQNAGGRTTYRGVEIEIVAVPVEGLTLNANYGYIDTKYGKYLFFDHPGNICGTPDTTCDVSNRGIFPTTPNNTFAFGAQYDFPALSFGIFSARVDATYAGNYSYGTVKTRFDDYIRTAGHTLVDAKLMLSDVPVGSDMGRLKFTLWGANLTNEEYRTYSIGAFESIGFAGSTYNEPRSYGLLMTYEYN